MSLTLYDASVLNYLQTLDAMGAILDKSLAHCREHDRNPEEIVAARLHADMLSFGFQVQQLALHSLGAVNAVLSGELNMRERKPPLDYAGLQAAIAGTRESLREIAPETVNARAGAPVIFNAPGRQMPFTAEGFLMSFSLPNFYFHATTAYALLRSNGVPLGKLDFVGALRLDV